MFLRKRTVLQLALYCGILPVYGQTVNPEKEHLKFYAPFDQSAAPAAALDGTALLKDSNVKSVPGKRGNAVYFAGDPEPPVELVYGTGSLFAGREWTIAFWAKLDRSEAPASGGKGRNRLFFRTYSTGAWKEGDMTAGISPWGRLEFNRFDGAKLEQSCWVSASCLPGGEWTHLAFSSNDGNAAVYINGFEAGYIKNAAVAKPGALQKGIRLGSSDHKSKNYLAGAIDELKIFDKALTADEVKLIMSPAADPNSLQPVLSAPFEGRADVSSSLGPVDIDGDRIAFQQAVIGQGAAFVRHGYDSRSRLAIKNVSGIAGKEMTAGFFFIPNWNGSDGGVHGLLGVESKDFNWTLKAVDGKLLFTLANGSGKNELSADIASWKQGRPVYVMAGYSLTTGNMLLAIDGKTVQETGVTRAFNPPDAAATLTVGDLPGADVYKKSQAEGVIDELRIFNVLLNDAQRKAEFERKDDTGLTAGTAAGIKLPVTAITAPERKLWDLNGAFKQKTLSREEICLNALWRFQLTENGQPPRAVWHYLAVPGRYSGHENGRSDHQFLIRNPDMTVSGKDQKWLGRPAHEFYNCWLERSFTADPSWKDRQIVLYFDELSYTGSGTLYLNGEKLAVLKDRRSYEIPLPAERLRYGADNTLTLHIVDDGNRYSYRGVKGDVYLRILPSVIAVNQQVLTSVRDHRLTVSADIANHSASQAEIRMTCGIKGKNAPGDIVSDPVVLKPGETRTVTIVKNWDNPVLWNYETPYLYEFNLKLQDAAGNTIDESPALKTGFREFWISGADYYLNGTKIHLRNHDEWMNSSTDYQWCRQYVKMLKSIGYNSLRGGFNDSNVYMENILRACDEEGLLLFINLFGVDNKEFVAWNNPETRKNLESKMASVITAWRNHPSIVMWYLSVNFLGYGWDYHPLKMADGYLPQFNQAKYKACMDGAAIMQRYDSSRPYFFQAGGAFGPVINSNAYFCWWPEAEIQAWPREWSRQKSKPLHIIETSFPYYDSFVGMDLRYPQCKPLFIVEHAARFFGQEAYKNVDPALYKLMDNPASRTRDDLKWQLLALYRDLDLVQQVEGRLLTTAIQHWRGAGISGVCPFAELNYAYKRKSPYKNIHEAYRKDVKVEDFRTPGWHPDVFKFMAHQDIDPERPLPLSENLKAALTPLLVYIGGEESSPDSQAGNYYAAATVSKTLTVINDTLETKNFRLAWALEDKSGTVYASGKFDESLSAGDIRNLKLEFNAPEVKSRTEFILKANAGAPAGISVKPFAITVFPEIKPVKPSGRVLLYDTNGMTEKTLRQSGVEYSDLRKTASLEGFDLLVIGRESLGPDLAGYAKKLKLAQAVEQGKINIAVFEQQPEALALLGLEACQSGYIRSVFKNPEAGFPRTLTSADLSNWQGEGSLSPSRPLPDPSTQDSVVSPLWHWTNLNMVSSYPVRRPSAGNYKIFASCGKDLVYSPLFELAAGSGKILFCQMEISGRTVPDPAAELLFAQIIEQYSTKNQPVQFRPLYYSGDAAGRQLLLEAGFNAEAFAGNVPSDAVIVVNKRLNAAEIKTMTECADAGATVVFMQLSDADASALQLALKPLKLESFESAGAQKFLSFLQARDRFFHYAMPSSVISGKGVIPLTTPAIAAEKTVGKGKFLFINLDTAAIDKMAQADAKIGFDSSNLWADSIVKERICAIWANALSELGCKGESIAGRFVNMNPAACVRNLAGKWDFTIDPDDAGLRQQWQNPENSGKGKRDSIDVPGYWENQGYDKPNKPGAKGYDGLAWYRKTVELDSSMKGKDIILDIGTVDDNDWTYVNGTMVGRTGEETPGYWAAPRKYRIPAALTADGRLYIAIRVLDLRGNGGIAGHIRLTLDNSGINNAVTPFPYYARPLPSYNTETSIRW